MVELVLIVHFLVILFFLLGFVLGLIWNVRWFRLAHFWILAAVSLLMVLGIPCPLTVLEEMLRGDSYQGSFIATWLNRIIYMVWFEPTDVLIADLIYFLLVGTSFYWLPLKPKENDKKNPPPKRAGV